MRWDRPRRPDRLPRARAAARRGAGDRGADPAAEGPRAGGLHPRTQGFSADRAGRGPARADPAPGDRAAGGVALELPRAAACTRSAPARGRWRSRCCDERPDLVVTASDASPAAAVEVARANGLDAVVGGGPPGRRVRPRRRQPALRARGRVGLALARYPVVRAAVCARVGARGPGRDNGAGWGGGSGTRLALEHAPAQAEAVRSLLSDAETHVDLAGRERVTIGRV